MRQLFGCLLLIVSTTVYAQHQRVEIWNFEHLRRQVLESVSDTTYVVNFWATWCRPCVEELPAFEALDSAVRQNKKHVKVLLVSLDFKKELESKLKSFIAKRNLRPRVVLFSDTDMNAWIDKVSVEWSGSIPATLIINNTKNIRQFFERQFDRQELFTIVNTLKGE